MKAAALVFLLASAARLAAETDPNDPDAFVPQTNLRKEIHAIYPYEPAAQAPAPAAPVLSPKPSPTSHPDFSEAGPSSPRATRRLNRLNAAIVQEEAEARSAAVARKLGIGLSTVPLGGGWRAGVATAFYIPVMVGVGIAW
jgi:hypothetical protein